jgi:hypothetical protein
MVEENYMIRSFTICTVTSWRMRLVGHVDCMGEMRNAKFWFKIPRQRDYFEYLGVDRIIILKFG